MTGHLSKHTPSGQRGFSVLELLIVVSMISVLVGFALMQVAEARQDITRENAAVQLEAYLEKARLDSVRRHPSTAAEMAQVSILNASFYSVTLDANWDGALDAPRVINLPASQTTNPRSIY